MNLQEVYAINKNAIYGFTFSLYCISLSGSTSAMQYFTLPTFLFRASTRADNVQWESEVMEEGISCILFVILPWDLRIPCSFHQERKIQELRYWLLQRFGGTRAAVERPQVKASLNFKHLLMKYWYGTSLVLRKRCISMSRASCSDTLKDSSPMYNSTLPSDQLTKRALLSTYMCRFNL